MSQSHQIRSLSATGRAGAESPQAARADTDNVTQAADWEVCPVFLDKPKPHCFRLARNWVAFFRISLSCLRSLISRRSRSFSLAKPKSFFETTSVPGCAVIHVFSVDIPTPPSRDIAGQYPVRQWIIRHLFPRQPACQCDPHRVLPEFVRPLPSQS